MEADDKYRVQDDLTFLDLIQRAIALPLAMAGLDCKEELEKILEIAEFYATCPMNEGGYIMVDD